MNDVIECQHIFTIRKTDLHTARERHDRSRLFYIYHLSCKRQLTTKWKLTLQQTLLSARVEIFENLNFAEGHLMKLIMVTHVPLCERLRYKRDVKHDNLFPEKLATQHKNTEKKSCRVEINTMD